MSEKLDKYNFIVLKHLKADRAEEIVESEEVIESVPEELELSENA